jgi:hypothetical protein
MAGFGIGGVDPSGCVTTLLVNGFSMSTKRGIKVKLFLCFN